VEEWLVQGGLSQAEFEQMVTLIGRYVRWDLDQFDYWVMPTDYGPWVRRLLHRAGRGHHHASADMAGGRVR
jgi:hypothetical protein